MKTKYLHEGKHLTEDDRKNIESGIERRLSKRAIANFIGKDETTIAKEIKNHRVLKSRNLFNYPSICIHRSECKGCKHKCSRFKEETCKSRDKSPGACNKCPDMAKCHLDKYFYSATKAHKAYRSNLVDFREGINLTEAERDNIANIIVPLINQGQSIYQILSAHPEITQCEKTLYNYINLNVFNQYGIQNISLKEKTKRREFKNKYKKRKEPTNYTGHTYNDYLDFINKNPDIHTVEMDTVSNDLSGPYIQTLMFRKEKLMLGLLRTEKTSESMAEFINIIENKLGHDLFRRIIPVILTDRGTEFMKNELFEFSCDGEKRLNIFYCDAQQSSQKPFVENNHNYVRDIIPNNISLDLLTQESVDLMFSHINSTPREIINGKTPFELFSFLYGKEVLEALNIKEVKRDEVILKPYLLKRKSN
jgi:IS30 family transposase